MTHVYGMAVAGVTVRTGCRVGRAVRSGTVWRVETETGPVTARWVINCAGNQADRLEAEAGRSAKFSARPGRGEFLVLEAAGFVGRPVVPVPSKQTAGVYVFETVYGQTVVGPTNIPQVDREDAAVSSESEAWLLGHLTSLYPAVSESGGLAGGWAGLRPGTQHQDYQLSVDWARCWVSVAGIRSTGLTCSLVLSRYLATTLVPSHTPAPLPVMPAPQRVPGRPEWLSIGGREYRVTHPITRHGLLGLPLPHPPRRASRL